MTLAIRLVGQAHLLPQRRFLRLPFAAILLCGLCAGPLRGQDDDQNDDEDFPPPVAAERAAAEAVRKLGGWYELDSADHVSEVNMVYHYGLYEKRQDNGQSTDEILEHLPSFSRIKRLLLKDSQASDAGLKFVGQLRNLESLYIWDGRSITDDGVAQLRGLSKLKTLHLSNAAITDEAIRHLSEIPAIESLSMQGNPFTDQALEFATRMPNLKSLVIDNGCRLTDEGMQHVRKMSRLETIWLHRTGISGKGLQELHGLPQLKTVWASLDPANDLNREAFDALQNANPDLVLRLDGKSLPSVNSRRDAADPEKHKQIREQAAEGVAVIENFLKLAGTKSWDKMAESSNDHVVTTMRNLTRQDDYDVLDVSVAYGDRESVMVLTSPAVIRLNPQPTLHFTVLEAKRQGDRWRVTSISFQGVGQNGVLDRFREEHVAAQQVR